MCIEWISRCFHHFSKMNFWFIFSTSDLGGKPNESDTIIISYVWTTFNPNTFCHIPIITSKKLNYKRSILSSKSMGKVGLDVGERQEESFLPLSCPLGQLPEAVLAFHSLITLSSPSKSLFLFQANIPRLALCLSFLLRKIIIQSCPA